MAYIMGSIVLAFYAWILYEALKSKPVRPQAVKQPGAVQVAVDRIVVSVSILALAAAAIALIIRFPYLVLLAVILPGFLCLPSRKT